MFSIIVIFNKAYLLTTFPQCNFWLKIPGLLSQTVICCHWLSVSRNSKMMDYGILINIAYWSHPIFMCMYAVAHTYIYEALLLGRRGRCCSPRNYNKPNSIWSIMLVKNITKTMMLCRRRNFIYLEKLSFITPTWDDDVEFMIRYIKLCNLKHSICILLRDCKNILWWMVRFYDRLVSGFVHKWLAPVFKNGGPGYIN